MKPNRNRTRDLGVLCVLLMVILIAVIFTMTKGQRRRQDKELFESLSIFSMREKVQSFKTEGNTVILSIRTGDAVKPIEEKDV